MNQVTKFFKRIRLSKIVAVFLAGFLLIFTQACAGKVSAEKPSAAGPNSEISVPKGDKILNSYEGGMNNFSDVDPRSKDAEDGAKARAKALGDNAAKNIETHSSNVKDATRRVAEDSKELGKNVQRTAESAKDKVGDTADDLAKGTKQGLENIKDNVKNAGGYFNKTAERTIGNPVENLKEGSQDAAEAANRTFREAGENAKSSTKDTGRDLANKTQNKIEDASDFLQDKARDAAKSVQRSFDKAGDALKDVVD